MLIEIAKSKKEDLPFSRHTAYKWSSLKRYPELIYKVVGKLYFDTEEWERMVKEAKVKNVAKVKKLRTTA